MGRAWRRQFIDPGERTASTCYWRVSGKSQFCDFGETAMRWSQGKQKKPLGTIRAGDGLVVVTVGAEGATRRHSGARI